MDHNAAVAAIQFALNTEEGVQFLRLWNEGAFDTIRKEWPEAPEAIYIGADPLHKDTPSSEWRSAGQADPHGKHYREGVLRSDLPMGRLTDDQLANAVYLYDHRRGLESIVYLTAAKERIRWLSRRLEEARAQQSVAVDEDRVERATMVLLGKSHDPVPGINWRCDRGWTVNRVRELMRDALTAAELSPVPGEVRINFPQVGTAGPFPVIDGSITLADSTMNDIIRHARTGYRPCLLEGQYDPALGVYDEDSLKAAGEYILSLEYILNAADLSETEARLLTNKIIAAERLVQAYQDQQLQITAQPT